MTLNGQDYPVLVRRVVTGPNRQRLAEASYYDDRAGAWKTIDDQEARARLAERVRLGQIEPWEKPEVQT